MPQYWGQGIATESSNAIVAYAFNKLNLQTLVGTVDPENVASIKVLKKVGFKFSESKPYPDETEILDWYKLKKCDYER